MWHARCNRRVSLPVRDGGPVRRPQLSNLCAVPICLEETNLYEVSSRPLSEVVLSTEYLLFVSAYATLLVIASFVVFTERGQASILRILEEYGSRTGAGPWGFLETFGRHTAMESMPIDRRAELAESYIATAQETTLVGARVSLWVLISGCAACAVAAALIVGVMPACVVSGAWAYEAYVRAAQLVVIGSAAGGLVMSTGLVAWLSRTVFHMNCSEGCAAARSLVAGVQRGGVSAELALELASGSYPRLRRLIDHAPH